MDDNIKIYVQDKVCIGMDSTCSGQAKRLSAYLEVLYCVEKIIVEYKHSIKD